MAGNSTTKIPQRNEVPTEYTWALEDLYATVDDWKKDMEKLKGLLSEIESYKGKLAKSSQELLGFLKLMDEITVIMDAFANYAFRKADEDTKNATWQGYKDQTYGLIVAISGASSFAASSAGASSFAVSSAGASVASSFAGASAASSF